VLTSVPGRLEVVCVHAADRMVTEWLDAPALADGVPHETLSLRMT
jgi:hypothetical protein